MIKELMGHESLATTAIYVDVPVKQHSAAVSLLPRLNQGARRLGSVIDGLDQLSLFE